MVTNEVQYRATKAHLDRFDEAAANIANALGVTVAQHAGLKPPA